MNVGEPKGEREVTRFGRRGFLVGAAAVATTVAAGCAGSDERAEGPTIDLPDVDREAFALGVASGDPTTDAVILWTRLAPDPLADDGSGGMGPDDVEVWWELAADDGFAEIVASGTVTASAAHGHAVHVDATGLAAGTAYWYRFRAGEVQSPVGRTATLPDGSPDRFGVAVVNCQMYESGAYAAYRHLAEEEGVDLVAHLGDYIYEYPGGSGEGRHSAPDRMVETLADYRIRYASYKADPDLQAAHARFPFVATWDDHEVMNNYLGDTAPDDATAEAVRARRTAAYQAWWEHLPVRLDPPVDGELRVYQALDVGDLARLHLLDERQYGDEPPCRNDESTGLDEGDCPEVDEERTRLGDEQEAWLAESLADSPARWNLLGNPVVLAGVDAGTDEPSYYLDTWDGYPRARARLIDLLADAANPVVLTGDYHAGMVLDVLETPFDPSSTVVAPEFMAPPISSALFPADVSARTPQLRQQLNAHGYLTVEVAPEQVTVAFRTLGDVTDPDTDVTTAATWVVDAGDPVARPA